MKSSDTAFAIGEIAQRFGLPTHVLRHWESMGLLTPARVSGRRRYTSDDLYRVAAILRGKEAGLSLDQIRQLMTATDPAFRNGVLRAQRDGLRGRIAVLEEELRLIDSILRCRHADFTRCPRFRGFVTERMAQDASETVLMLKSATRSAGIAVRGK